MKEHQYNKLQPPVPCWLISGAGASVRQGFAPKSCSLVQKRQTNDEKHPLASGYTLPAIGRVMNLYRFENLRAERTKRKDCPKMETASSQYKTYD